MKRNKCYCPKQKKAIDKLIVEPLIKNAEKTTKKEQVDRSNNEEEDSLYTLPSTMVGTKSSKICKEVEPLVPEMTTDEVAIVTIYTDKTNTFWKNTEVPFKTIIQ